jgi:eukaryotic-like serine/threonine-protein kinase
MSRPGPPGRPGDATRDRRLLAGVCSTRFVDSNVVDATVTDPLVGRTLDGRYLVQARIARGGMATVYVALDTRLDRVVAMKVMNAGFADDPDFVARFTREARSAARLSHPNVVAVFDQGSDADTGAVFLAMEYVSGKTLREVLRSRGRLPADEALDIMRQVLAGLAAAEQAGLVHRDVKPENVLIADDGQVKVVDFGLVRAAEPEPGSGQTTQGVLMGTAAYLAPEQVEHGTADSRTDVYSAGIVLYEMLTGAPPFVGDTALSVAFQHVHSDVPAPSASVPDTPSSVDALVRSATQRNRDDRPANAGVLLTAVIATRAALPRRPAAPADDTYPTVIVSRDAVDSAAAAAAAGASGTADGGELRPRKRWRGWVGALIVVLLALAAAGLGFWLTVGRYTSVPGVVGMKADTAIAKLQDAGLKGTVGDSAFSATIPKGEVVTSDPSPGSRVKEGATVTLTVSKGPESIPVPSVVGQPLDQAEKQIRAAGLAVGQVTRAYSETVDQGSVISANPAPGKELRPNSPVNLTVSKGPAPIPIPNVVGKTEADARSILTSAGFRVSTSSDYSDTVPDGSVISQNPSSGARPANTVIALVISKGPKLYPIPKVVGMKLEAAIKALEAAGFVPDVYNTPGGPNVVIVQSPGPGVMAPHGATVTLTVV